VKLLAEPVRLWLLVDRNERVATREGALRRGLSELPDEGESLQLGLNLLNGLDRSPNAPLPEVIAALLRQTERLAQHMTAAADAAGYSEVKLTGGGELVATPELLNRIPELPARGQSGELLPLADWRARAVPNVPDEVFRLIRANAVDAPSLAAMAEAGDGTAIPACRCNSLLLLPTTDFERGMLRAVQCQPTDPVSIALADGHTLARFPELAGWSALHCARRAVAEHRAWLASDAWVFPSHGWVGVQSAPNDPKMRTLGLLFTAARAALFLESIVDGDPELAVTVAGVADCLVARDSSCSDLVHSALHDFRASRAGDANNPIQVVAAMLDAVRNLSAYSGASALSMTAR
jgi:hypothetical protein